MLLLCRVEPLGPCSGDEAKLKCRGAAYKLFLLGCSAYEEEEVTAMTSLARDTEVSVTHNVTQSPAQPGQPAQDSQQTHNEVLR